MLIDSSFNVLNGVVADFSEKKVKDEPMLFNCDLYHATHLGGPITNAVLDLLPEDWRNVPLVIDSRVHMLMKGWYPCIPGWHHDDVPRTRHDGQPDYANSNRVRSEHIICLINGDVAPTAFAIGASDFELPEGVVYEQWHLDVEQKLRTGDLQRVSAPSNRLIKFTDDTWHTGTKAVGNGWRFFIRISRHYGSAGVPVARSNKLANEIRRQVNVYMDNPNAGW